MKNLIERAEAKLDEWGAKLEQKNIEYPVDLICGILFLVIGIVLLLIMPQQVQISEKDVVNIALMVAAFVANTVFDVNVVVVILAAAVFGVVLALVQWKKGGAK